MKPKYINVYIGGNMMSPMIQSTTAPIATSKLMAVDNPINESDDIADGIMVTLASIISGNIHNIAILLFRLRSITTNSLKFIQSTKLP